jgi:hypothetical protein
MTCDNCEKVTDSRIGLTLRGPFVCKDCFNIRGSLFHRFTLDGKKVTRQLDVTLPVVPKRCNRHDDCAAAVENWKRNHNGEAPGLGFHCHDDECEDCFGC